MIGLIGAMGREIEGLMARVADPKETNIGMERFISGRLFGQEAVLAVCGPGKINAALCAQSMILHFHPDWVLNLGAAGAGEDGMAIGDMVVATAAVQHDVDTSTVGDPVGLVSKLNVIEFPCDAALRARLVAAAAVLKDARIHEGIIATGDQFVNQADVRQAIHDRFQARAIEMEGAAVAHACYVMGVPCGVLRSISDKADGHSDMDYPAFVELAAGHSMQVVEALLTEMGR